MPHIGLDEAAHEHRRGQCIHLARFEMLERAQGNFGCLREIRQRYVFRGPLALEIFAKGGHFSLSVVTIRLAYLRHSSARQLRGASCTQTLKSWRARSASCSR